MDYEDMTPTQKVESLLSYAVTLINGDYDGCDPLPARVQKLFDDYSALLTELEAHPDSLAAFWKSNFKPR